MRRALALVLSITIIAPACATTRAMQVSASPRPGEAAVDRALLVAYVKQLPVGSRVRASLTSGDTVRGTLMQASDSHVVIQRRTRIPEPPLDLAVDRIASLELDSPTSIGKAIAAGAGAGAGAALGVFLLLIAIYSD
jgi:hypothetical protein